MLAFENVSCSYGSVGLRDREVRGRTRIKMRWRKLCRKIRESYRCVRLAQSVHNSCKAVFLREQFGTLRADERVAHVGKKSSEGRERVFERRSKY